MPMVAKGHRNIRPSRLIKHFRAIIGFRTWILLLCFPHTPGLSIYVISVDQEPDIHIKHRQFKMKYTQYTLSAYGKLLPSYTSAFGFGYMVG